MKKPVCDKSRDVNLLVLDPMHLNDSLKQLEAPRQLFCTNVLIHFVETDALTGDNLLFHLQLDRLLPNDSLDDHVVANKRMVGRLEERVIGLPDQCSVAVAQLLKHVVDDDVHLPAVFCLVLRVLEVCDA